MKKRKKWNRIFSLLMMTVLLFTELPDSTLTALAAEEISEEAVSDSGTVSESSTESDKTEMQSDNAMPTESTTQISTDQMTEESDTDSTIPTEETITEQLTESETTSEQLTESETTSEQLTQTEESTTEQATQEETGTTELSAEPVTETIVDETIEVADEEMLTVEGSLTLAPDIFVEGGGLSGYLYVYYDSNSYKSIKFTIPEKSETAGEQLEIPYTVSIPETAASITRIYYSISSNSSVKTNLVVGRSVYSTGEGWSLTNSELNAPVEMTEGVGANIDLTLQKAKVYGHILLPENAFIESGRSVSATVYAVYDETGSYKRCSVSSIKKAEGDEGKFFYRIDDFPLEAEKVTRLSVQVSSSNASNLMTGQYEYYKEDGGLTTDKNLASSIEWISGSVVKDLQVKTVPVAGRIVFPENMIYDNGDISGTVYAKAHGSSSYDYQTSFSVTQQQIVEAKEAGKAVEAAYYFNGIPDIEFLDGLKLRIRSNSYVKTNLLTGTDLFYDGEKLTTETEAKSAIEQLPNKAVNASTDIRLTPLTSKLHMRIKLNDNVEFSENDLKGQIRVYFKDNTSSYYTKDITITRGEWQSDDVYFNNIPIDADQVEKISVYWNDNGATTNFLKGTYLYYSEKADGSAEGSEEPLMESVWTTAEKTFEYVLSEDGSEKVLEFKAPEDSLQLKISLPEGDEIVGSPLKGTITARVGSRNYTQNFKIEAGMVLTGATIALPDDTTQVDYLKLRLSQDESVSTDLLWNTDLYLKRNEGAGIYELTTTEADKTAIDLTAQTDPIDVILVKTRAYSGVIQLPEGAYIEGGSLTGQVYAKINNSSYRSYFSIPEGGTSVKYVRPIPETATEITELRITIDSNSKLATNVLKGKTYYHTADGYTTDSSAERTAIDISNSTDLGVFVPEKIKSLNGSITLPEDSFIENGNVQVTVRARVNDGSEYSTSVTFSADDFMPSETVTDDESEPGESIGNPVSKVVKNYHVILNDDAQELEYIRVDTSKDYNTVTNIGIFSYLYLDENGALTDSKEQAKGYVLEYDETFQNLTLLKAPVISGNIRLAEGAYFSNGTLSGTLYAQTDQGSYNMTFEMQHSSTIVPYRCILPWNAEKINYLYVRLSSNALEGSDFETNVNTESIQYCDMDGKWYQNTNEIAASDITSMDMQFDVVIPRTKSIKGTISLPEEAFFRGGDYHGTITYIVNGNEYSYEYTLAEGERSTSYELQLPGAASNAVVRSNGNNADTNVETNLVQDTIYLGSLDEWSMEQGSDMVDISAPDVEKNIVLEYKRIFSGNINVPADAQIDVPMEGRVCVRANSKLVTSDFAISREDNSGLSYSVELPVGAKKIDYVYVNISDPGTGRTDLLTGTDYYYSPQEQRWGYTLSEVTGQSLTVTGVDTTLDVDLKKAVTLSGTISLENNSYFRGANLTGYINVFVDGIAYISYFNIPDGETGRDYLVKLPLNGENIDKIQCRIYANSVMETDLITNEDLYLTDSGWSRSDEKAKTIKINQNRTVLNIKLPRANIISGTIRLPEKVTASAEGTVVVVCDDVMYSDEFSIGVSDSGSGSAKYRISLPAEDSKQYKLYYILDMENSDRLATGKIYVAADGTYAVNADSVEPYMLRSGVTDRSFTLAAWSDMETGALLESPHPYSNGKDYSLGYTYPGTADALVLHFSKYTSVEDTFDEILIYNSKDELLGTYTGAALAGQDVRIEDKGFKVVLSADSVNNYYGFAIDSIEVVNGVTDGTIAISLIYENDEAVKTMIHNAAADTRSFYISKAYYDIYGKMLDLTTKKISVSASMAAVDLGIIQDMDASTAKLMIYNEDFAPICTEQYKAYPKYTIVYKSNDVINSSRVVYVPAGGVAETPGFTIEKAGYSFNGWYTDTECTQRFTFGNEVTEDITLYAGWIKKYSVNVKVVGEGNVESEEIDGLFLDKGREASIKAVPDENWVFDKWNVEGVDNTTQKNDSIRFTMPGNDITITAVFKREVEVIWAPTGLFIGEEEVAFDENHILYVPTDYDKVTLKGSFDTSKNNVTALKYSYSYFGMDEESKEAYITLEPKELTLGENAGFTISDLPIGVGSNALILDITVGSKVIQNKYFLLGNKNEITYGDSVENMDLESVQDALKIKDFATGIVAFWRYDNGTPEDVTDDKDVIIVTKESEIGQRLMLPDDEENSIGVGTVWIIPACDQFPAGFSFKIADFGDAEFAPEAPENDIYYNTKYSSDKYLYMLTEEPEISDVFQDSFSLNTAGIKGVTFSLLPENTVMECSMTQEDGSTVMATAGSLHTTDNTVLNPGFQYQNLINMIIPSTTTTASSTSIKMEFGDVILYDKDGSKNTTWDQLVVSGELGIEDLAVEGVFEYHPSISWKGVDLLPQQVGMILDYTEKREFKLGIGGTLGGNADAGEDAPSGQWSLEDVVKDFKKKFGYRPDDDKKKDEGILGIDVDLEGIDMDNTIVLAAIGFELAGRTPVSGGYQQIEDKSTYLGFDPVMIFMICMDLDGEISAKIEYSYVQSTYNAKGFNIQREGVAGANAKIERLAPSKEMSVAGYNVEVFNVAQRSAVDQRESVGVHTVTVTGEAEINTSLCGAAALMISGLNIAQVKGGVYADADAAVVGSITMQKDEEPEVNLDGSINISIGLMVGFYTRFFASASIDWLDWEKKVGFEKEWEKKFELLHYGLTSISCSGTVTEPTQVVNGTDKPLSGVKVTLKKKRSTENDKEVYTNAEGKYSFNKLGQGEYELTFEKEGYVTAKEEFEVEHEKIKKDVSMGLASFMEIDGKIIFGDTRQPAANAQVILTKPNEAGFKITKRTDAEGMYQFGAANNETIGITPGVYKISVKYNGYREITQQIVVSPNDTGIITADDMPLVSGAYGNGTVTGCIRDIATGNSTGIPLRLELRKGMNDTAAAVINTYVLSADGAYSFTLPTGYYTVTVIDPRTNISDDAKYFPASFAILSTADQTTTQDAYVSRVQSEDQIRIILTWGATPSDLDSHLLGPTADGSGRFHTYYSDKGYYNDGDKYADLDLDDTSSYGPETTTIYYKNGSGIYSFYVHDYSNRDSSNTTAMALSGATVKVYKGTRLVATYYVPTTGGTLWHVFDYDASADRFIPYDEMTYVESPEMVGAMSAMDNSLEAQDINTIMSDLVEK